MKITVFTSNQPRHVALVNSLSEVSDELFCVQECTTVLPGKIDDFYKRSPLMQTYFANVVAAERELFGHPAFIGGSVKSVSIRKGDLSHLERDMLEDCLHSDVYVIFGASYIKGWLIDFLVAHNAVNIHMGLSPYYRGSSCNFWAIFDDNPRYVGATIHRISKGLDSGPMLYHCLPVYERENIFEFTMKSVLVAHSSLVDRVDGGEIFQMHEVSQSRCEEIRYTKNADFTDSVVESFLARELDEFYLAKRLSDTSYPDLVKPYFGGYRSKT